MPSRRARRAAGLTVGEARRAGGGPTRGVGGRRASVGRRAGVPVRESAVAHHVIIMAGGDRRIGPDTWPRQLPSGVLRTARRNRPVDRVDGVHSIVVLRMRGVSRPAGCEDAGARRAQRSGCAHRSDTCAPVGHVRTRAERHRVGMEPRTARNDARHGATHRVERPTRPPSPATARCRSRGAGAARHVRRTSGQRPLTAAVSASRPAFASAKYMPVLGSMYSSLSMPA